MTDNPKRVFLIHGFNGSPQNHWFPWLRTELVANHFEVFAPAMPDPEAPIAKDWIEIISDWVGIPDENTILVGHSLGCIAVVRYLESLKNGKKIAGAIFVAGFSGNTEPPELKTFWDNPIDFEKVKEHGGKMFSIFSDNDEVVPMEKSFDFGKKLGAKLLLEKGKGHFTSVDGVKSLPIVMECVLRSSNFKTQNAKL